MPNGKSVLISQGHPFPYGTIIEVNLSGGKIVRHWKGLDEPRAIAVYPDSAFALVTSRNGIYKLDLR